MNLYDSYDTQAGFTEWTFSKNRLTFQSPLFCQYYVGVILITWINLEPQMDK